MNLSFYAAISRAPLGIVVAVEFLGPMAVAVMGTRRPLDLLWIALAGGGVLFLAGPSGSVSAAGLIFSLISASLWAAYLLLAKRSLAIAAPWTLTVWMLGGSAIALTPVALAGGLEVVGEPPALLLAAGVAVLASAIPYFLELVALRFVRAATYGVLLSIEPAVAVLAGWAVLGQRLTLPELAAMAAVMVAAAGASWTAGGAAKLDAPSV
jgi:inner membrane transporter RhtA